MIDCPRCGGTSSVSTPRIIRSGRSAPYPRWLLQVKETCGNCGAYIRFAPQTEQLIDALNAELARVRLEAA
jgi:hypothetical protein